MERAEIHWHLCQISRSLSALNTSTRHLVDVIEHRCDALLRGDQIAAEALDHYLIACQTALDDAVAAYRQVMTQGSP